MSTGPIRCPYCGSEYHHVSDSRSERAYRRRECDNPDCEMRFTTDEVVRPIWNTRQPKHRTPHVLRQPSLI